TPAVRAPHSTQACSWSVAFPFSSLLFFTLPPPPTSTLFPYTTLFRSILVWQEVDDPNLLRHAARARDVGRNPRVTGYRSEYGPSASYYAWIAAGRPVHGVKAHR